MFDIISVFLRFTCLFALLFGVTFSIAKDVVVNINSLEKDVLGQSHMQGVALGGGNVTYLDDKYYKPVSELNIKVVRLEAVTADYRGLYNPVKKKWNYDKLDNEIYRMKQSGAMIVANIFYTPKFLSSCPNEKTYFYCPPLDINEWSSYVENIVRHINYEKKFGISYWEIGNEPSGAHFFKAPMNEFWKFYLATAAAVKKADPNAKVGGFADNAFYIQHYRDFFEKVKGTNLLDFVSFHWYGEWGKNGSPRDLYEIAQRLRLVMGEYGEKSLPLFLTEWNLMAEKPGVNGVDKLNSYFLSEISWIEKAKIDKSFFFRVEPYKNVKASLIDAKGKVGSVGHLFSLISSLSEKRVEVDSSDSDVSVISARSDNGVEIVATNYAVGGGVDKNVRFIVSGLSCDKNGKFHQKIFIEDRVDQLDGSFLCENEKIVLEAKIPLYEVLYIEIPNN